MTETTASPDQKTASEAEFRVVQRTIMRADQELDVRPLYFDGVSSFGSGRISSGQSGADTTEDSDDEASEETDSAEAARGTSGYGRVTSTGGVAAAPERRLTFGTYFNAFPASYWRRWTEVSSVRLVVKVKGQGSIIVYRSTAKGQVLRADSEVIDTPTTRTLEFDLALKPFIDGGWYWFDIEAGDREIVLEEAVWGVETDKTASGSVTVGITTFNRPDFCVDQLVNFAENHQVLDIIDEILVVDQGNQRVEDDENYGKAAAALGDKLRVINQGNLGGSGGFSRAMAETLARGRSDYVLLLDDDVVCELEGIARAVTFADLATKPTVVGGQMFSLYNRSVLRAQGESVDKYRWFWGAAPNTKHDHDLAKRSLQSTPWLHRRIDVDYNGWWMCLIPTQVIREIGLSLPMFIKWDDAEYGVRAGEAGYPTVTLPGVAVWHVPWTEKDDTIDWQAYFHMRNRIVSALLHSPYDRGGRLVREVFEAHAKHTVSMQYAPAEMILLAISDVLDGPERMHRDMTVRLGELRELRKAYPDSQSQPGLDRFPPPRREKPPRKGRAVVTPTGPVGRVHTAAKGLLRQFKPVRSLSTKYPETVIPHLDQRWWRFMQFDSALVSSADGSAVAWYRRDPKEFRSQIERAARLHVRLYREWPKLAERYREALPELTSAETWKSTFESPEDGKLR